MKAYDLDTVWALFLSLASIMDTWPVFLPIQESEILARIRKAINKLLNGGMTLGAVTLNKYPRQPACSVPQLRAALHSLFYLSYRMQVESSCDKLLVTSHPPSLALIGRVMRT